MSSERDESRLEADVLVLGASFAGIEVVYQLRRMARDALPRIIVVDRHRQHGYLPLVQERLLGTIDPKSTSLASAAYIESVPGARFVQGEIIDVDTTTHVVSLADGTRLRARIVVIALGSVLASPPAMPGGHRLHAHKSPEQFLALQTALDRLRNGELASSHIAVIGGGISGVELAGELATVAQRRHARWPQRPNVTLVGSQPRLVSILRPKVGVLSAQILAAQGVDVRLATRLVAVDEDAIEVACGGKIERLRCALPIWVGGIQPAPLLATIGVPRTADGWLAVSPTLQCDAARDPELFACGDAVRISGGNGPWATMHRAIECIWQAKVVARNVLTLLARPAGYANGVPPLHPHRLRENFAYGVSLGRRSLVVWGPLCIDVAGLNHGFRRWLMRQYFARYAVTTAR